MRDGRELDRRMAALHEVRAGLAWFGLGLGMAALVGPGPMAAAGEIRKNRPTSTLTERPLKRMLGEAGPKYPEASMSKSNAANVIDLEAFRQRKMLRVERTSEEMMPMASGAPPQAVMVPVWFCWVPMWTPTYG